MLSNTIYQNLSQVPNCNMHYVNRYIKFISACNNLTTDPNDKTHAHHILPRSMWPEYTDLNANKWNKSILTVRQHYIAHLILAKAVGGKMWQAFWYMINLKGHDNVSSRIYEMTFNGKFTSEWRENISNHRRKYLKQIDPETGLTLSKLNSIKVAEYMTTTYDENGVLLSTKRALATAATKRNTVLEDGKTLLELIGNKISKAHNTRNEETGLTPAEVISMKVSKIRKELGLSKGELNPQYGKYGKDHPKYGHKHSDETKRKQSEALKGKPHKTGKCIVCGKECNVSNLSRWHNDNCKFKSVQ